MKRIFILSASILFSSIFVLSSGIKSIQENFYKAYISGNVGLWISSMNELQTMYNATGDYNTLYELTHSQYGYIGLLIDNGQLEKAKEKLPGAERNAEKLVKANPNLVDYHALKAGIHGFKIMLYPSKVAFYGPKGKKIMQEAYDLGKFTPAILVEMGNYKYHTPAILGGNVNEAIEYFKYAVQYYEQIGKSTNNWQYLNTMVWLAISYDKAGNKEKAKKTLVKIIEYEPGFTYVKDKLYPVLKSGKSLEKTYFEM